MSIDEVMAIAAEYKATSRWSSDDGSATLRAAIEQHVAEAIAREREECALICDSEGREWDSDAVVTLKNYAEHCAAAIRARAEKGGDMSELRDQHKAFAEWLLTQNPIAPNVEDMAWAAWKAALAQPEAHPPRDEWRDAVHDELVTTWTFTDKNKDDPRLALRDIINWHVSVSLDPAISSDAQALIERGKAMRSGWRPASEPPEDDRNVIVWYTPNDPTKGAPGGLFFHGFFRNGEWWPYSGSETITHWRDIEPPEQESSK